MLKEKQIEINGKCCKLKEFICICLDVTSEDIEKSIKEGYDNIEIIKRYTGCTMGLCQGKQCMINFVNAVSKCMNKPIEELMITTIRPPIRPIPLGALGSEKKKDKMKTNLKITE